MRQHSGFRARRGGEVGAPFLGRLAARAVRRSGVPGRPSSGSAGSEGTPSLEAGPGTPPAVQTSQATQPARSGALYTVYLEPVRRVQLAPEHGRRLLRYASLAHHLADVGTALEEAQERGLRYLAVGPTGAFVITPTNGRWTRTGLLELEHAARAVDRLLPRHDFSPTRVRLVLAPTHPALRAQVLGVPGARRIWLIKANELYAYLK